MICPKQHPATARHLSRHCSRWVLVLISLLAVFSGFGQVILHEFLAKNARGLLDEDAEREDWIELHNTSTTPVSLSGWHLTDDTNRLTKWTFPATNLAGKAYLVVFASGKNRAVAGRELHASFKLSDDGGFLALVRPDGKTIEHQFRPYPPLAPDVSYGISSTNQKFFATPTPGLPNATGYNGISPLPKLSVPSGAYTNEQLFVSASAGMSGTIRYTTNGLDPTATSPAFPTPRMTLSGSTHLRLRFYQPGMIPSPVVTYNIILLGSDLRTFSSNLPLLVVDTFGTAFPYDGTLKPKTRAGFAAFEPFRGRTWFTNAPTAEGRAWTGIRGSSSYGAFPKKSYNFEVQDEEGNELDVGLFGLPPESDWSLYGPYSDKTMMRNALVYTIGREMGLAAPRIQFFELFADTTGGKLTMADHKGLYVLVEKIKRGDHRVDIAKLRKSNAQAPEITGGYIFKRDRLNTGESGFTTSPRGINLPFVDPKESELTAAQKIWIKGYMDQFEAALDGPNWTHPELGYARYIDVRSFIDNHIMVEAAKNIDGYRLSNYYYKDRNGKVFSGPLWDYNLSLGNADYLTGWQTNGWYYTQIDSTATSKDYPWYGKLFTDPDFKQAYIDRWAELRKDLFATTNWHARVDAYAALLQEAQVRNFNTWKNCLGVDIWPNWYVGQTYADEVNWLKGWIRGRFDWIDSNWLAAPTFSRPGGKIDPGLQLSMSAPQGSIYYTLDGSDPRSPGGAISPQAVLYLAPFQISENVRVFARAYASNSWSAPTVASYYTVVPPVRITELMYHPSPPPSGSPYATDDFEFLELRNLGTEVLNLAGLRLAGAIDFRVGGEVPSSQDQLNQNPTIAPVTQTVSQGVGTELAQDFDQPGTVFVPRIHSGTSPPELLSDGGSSGTFLRLAPATASIHNSVVFSRVLSRLSNAVASFDFRITGPSASGEGFGVALLKNAASLPLDTSSGFAETPNLPGAVGLGFDLGGAGTASDPAAPHISIHFDGAQVSPNPVVLDWNIANGKFHRACLQLEFVGGSALLSLRIIEDVLGPDRRIHLVYQQFAIPGSAPYEGQVAFGARNGGSPAAIDLDNVHFRYGNSRPVLLWPGEYALVVARRDAFEARYGTGLPVVGEYQRRLSNSRERIILEGPLGEPISDFTYESTWYPVTDGLGFSLVLDRLDATNDQLNERSSWRPSGWMHGSPAAEDPPLPAVPPVVVTEVLAHTDLPAVDQVELHNPTSQTVDLGGWFLSDELRKPFKYRMPSGTTISPYGHLTLTEAHFNPTPGKNNSFSLGARGEEIFLYSGDAAGALTGYFDGFAFGPSFKNTTLGRFFLSTGEPEYFSLAQPTLGSRNTGPALSPVVISELMYRPPDVVVNSVPYDNTEEEFVELYNGSSSPVPLYDTLNPALPWRLGGGIGFQFPTNLVMAPKSYLLVVNFDPTNTAMASAFRTKYKLPTSVPLRGPYQGKLGNLSDRVTLLKPDGSEPGEAPYVVVDQVRYRVQAPWPAGGNGDGKSLQRRSPLFYGNDPVNWIAATPTPAASNPGDQSVQITLHPQSQRVQPGASVLLQVAGTGSGTLKYFWMLDGVLLPGAASSSLTLPSIQSRQAGRYQAGVMDQYGLQLSNPAEIVVVQDTDGDGLPDDWEIWGGLNPNNSADADLDSDGDGLTNRQEYLAGTHPGQASSVLRVERVILGSGSRVIEFQAAAGKTYTVLYSEDLSSWHRLQDVTAPAQDGLVGATDTQTGSRRYYRVVTPSLPPAP